MSGGMALAGGLAALAVLLATHRRGASTRSQATTGRDLRGSAAFGTGGLCVMATAGAATMAGRSVVWAYASVLAAGALLMAVRTMVRSHRQREDRRRRRHEVIDVCDALVAEMRAGLPAQRAVTNACSLCPELAGVAASARLGGDIVAALTTAAQRPGAEGLRLVAAGWQVSARSGAGLAAVLDRIAASLRADEEAHAEVVAALGPPRATAKLLASLPLVGLVLGTAMGVDPLGFLLTTGVGIACLLAGVALAITGLWWVQRLADAVES
jgi:tight adherence protein B